MSCLTSIFLRKADVKGEGETGLTYQGERQGPNDSEKGPMRNRGEEKFARHVGAGHSASEKNFVLRSVQTPTNSPHNRIRRTRGGGSPKGPRSHCAKGGGGFASFQEKRERYYTRLSLDSLLFRQNGWKDEKRDKKGGEGHRWVWRIALEEDSARGRPQAIGREAENEG